MLKEAEEEEEDEEQEEEEESSSSSEEMDFDEDECAGLVKLPPNAKICRTNFSLSNMKEIEKADLLLITNIISYCSHHIATKDDQVKAYVTTSKTSFKGQKLVKYVLFIEMPVTIKPGSRDLNEIHFLGLHLMPDSILVVRGDNYTALEVKVYSHSNPYVTEDISLTRMNLKKLKFASFVDDDDLRPGPIKRKRKSSIGPSGDKDLRVGNMKRKKCNPPSK